MFQKATKLRFKFLKVKGRSKDLVPEGEMDKVFKLCSKGSISLEYFIQGRKIFTKSVIIVNRPLTQHSQFFGVIRKIHTVSSFPIINRPLINGIHQGTRCYSMSDSEIHSKQDSLSPASDVSNEGANKIEETIAQAVATDEGEGKQKGENGETETSESETSPLESPTIDGVAYTSKSQTGEPLPSEQDQSDWDNKLDKLYKQIELEVLSYEPSVLDSYQWFVLTTASHLGIQAGKCWSPMKSKKSRFPLLKSVFVHKKHQVHYEIRTYHRFMTFYKLTGSTADTFLEYIERNLPEGVGLKVTRVEAKAIPKYLQTQSAQQL